MVLERVKHRLLGGGGIACQGPAPNFAAIWRLWLDKGTTLGPEPLNGRLLRRHPASPMNADHETENL